MIYRVGNRHDGESLTIEVIPLPLSPRLPTHRGDLPKYGVRTECLSLRLRNGVRIWRDEPWLQRSLSAPNRMTELVKKSQFLNKSGRTTSMATGPRLRPVRFRSSSVQRLSDGQEPLGRRRDARGRKCCRNFRSIYARHRRGSLTARLQGRMATNASDWS